MATRRELNLRSYDRLFPSQDTLPRGGFGNLIALPFQREPRRAGNSLFLDERFEPFSWDEQWRFLARVPRLPASRVSDLARDAERDGRVLGVGFASTDGDDEGDVEPWNRPPSTSRKRAALAPPPPTEVKAVLAQQLFVDKAGLAPGHIGRLKRLAAFQNPEFYERQRLRLSTGRTPRIISCAEDLPAHLALPRGCLADLTALLSENGSRLVVETACERGQPLQVAFQGTLTPVQDAASRALLEHDFGVVVAPPGAGKTVIGTYAIAQRGVSTLVLVHRRPLLDQWINQIAMFTGLSPSSIGQVAGGKWKPNGLLDVAMIQSLVRKGEVDEIVTKYGHVVVDECHHVPSVSFERVLKQIKAQFITGLTATPRRRDGHHPIARMQLGPVRFTIDAKAQAEAKPFTHKLVVRETEFSCKSPDASIHEIYKELAGDSARNEAIVHDVARALDEGRTPLVLTERKQHLEVLADLLGGVCRRVIVLRGGLTPGETRTATERLARSGPSSERVVVATGKFIGEGFDDARLDTLFLTMPISWKGTRIQYAGRIQRLHPAKREVRIYDYVDRRVAMLARMFERRLRGYRAIGYAEREMPENLDQADDDFVLGRGWEDGEDLEDAGGEVSE
jgi:superfamily II DNA or RNA helicase